MRDPTANPPTFWMNVTTSANWHRSPVGIVRVEQEIRRELRAMLGERFRPIVLKGGKFTSEHASSWQTGQAGDFWPEPSYGSSADLFDPLKPVRSTPGSPPKRTTDPQFAYRDVLITMGLDWEYPDLHPEIRRCAQSYNLTVIACCYDLIPVLFPQYCVGDVASWFKQYIIDMTWSADGILCISENTQRDYLELARGIGLPDRRTKVIKLGSSLPAQSGTADVSKDVEQVLQSRFFLFVSTIERRKNHEVLYRAYHLIREQHPDVELPKLVFVGMEGWGVTDLMSDIRLDPLIKADIVILPHVSDAELLRLYRQCEAFLYPSLYEGWGLPVAEALQLGRPVLASRVGSIPEVGGDLVRYLDPWSPREWAEELFKIANGETDLESWSTQIASTFTPYEWSSAAKTLVALADELRAAKSPTLVLEPGYDLSTVNGIHYADKIIYEGRQGIVCHGPYIELARGRYDVAIEITWIEGARGVLRFKARHRHGEANLATKEIRSDALSAGVNSIVLAVDISNQIDDFEIVCEVECLGEVKVSVDKVEIKRVEPATRVATAAGLPGVARLSASAAEIRR